MSGSFSPCGLKYFWKTLEESKNVDGAWKKRFRINKTA